MNSSGVASRAGEGPVVAGSGFRTLGPKGHTHGGALKKGAFVAFDHAVDFGTRPARDAQG